MSESQQTLTIQEALDLAVQHHTAGRLSDAETIYQQILQTDPNQPVALHLLGVIAHQEGRNDVAVDLITKALAIRPDYVDAHNNLGNALKDLGKVEEAEASYHEAITIEPDLADAHNNLGSVLRDLGRLEEAVASYRKAIDLKPDYPEAHSNLGLGLQQLGKLEEALASYRRALALKPDYAEAHYYLGSALQKLGRLEEAMASYGKALAIKPDYANAHYNFGNVLRGLRRLEEAVARYQKALTLKPNLAEAHSNLGDTLRELGRLDEAVVHCKKAVNIKPDFAEAHNKIGNVLLCLAKPEEAINHYRKALTLEPDYAVAHNNLGLALQELGKLEEAVASHRKALALKPDYAEAHSALGHILGELDHPTTEAIISHRRAVALNPQNDLFWAGFAACLETVSFVSVDDNLYEDLLHLLERPTVRPSGITQPVISALRHHPVFSSILEATGPHKQDVEFTYSEIAEQLSTIPLFLRILELSPICDLEIERMLTVLRHAMLEEVIERKAGEKVLPFSVALTNNCFANEYAFAETEEEKEAVEKLEQQIARRMETGHPVPPSFVVTLGAYRLLFDFPWAQKLSKWKWGSDIAEVIKRQITEPLEELSLRIQIPCITAIQNTVSQSVREQYEENPYPRWIKTGLINENRNLGTVLRRAPFCFDLGDYTSPESPEILVAGCGTGQHALYTASKYVNAHVLAVDLSLNSLAYAERKTRELGVSNIEYVQGDILELGQLGRQFDSIECTGVLHHLGDPPAGWQVLADLLRPGGLMKVGLYSEIARQDIIAGRSLISEKGYSTSTEDIHRCRQDIIAMAANGNTQMAKICDSNNFFSTSECRDLLFHVQEQRLTLPQIEAALKSLQLRFLGFEMRNRIVERKFKELHPNKSALASLSLWHKFELDNRDTFIGMYQFWCKKL